MAGKAGCMSDAGLNKVVGPSWRPVVRMDSSSHCLPLQLRSCCLGSDCLLVASRMATSCVVFGVSAERSEKRARERTSHLLFIASDWS